MGHGTQAGTPAGSKEDRKKDRERRCVCVCVSNFVPKRHTVFLKKQQGGIPP